MIKYIIDNWMALLALLISLLALFKDVIKDIISYNNKKKDLKKADIKIRYINKQLIISNYGKSAAKNIKIFINDKSIFDTPLFNVYAKEMDFSILTPGNSFGIKHVEVLGMEVNYKIKVVYDDELKKNNEVEDVINTL